MDSSDEIFEPINLGNNKEYSILETAEIILSKIKTTSKIIFKELPQDDPQKRKPDIKKAKELLNWEPKISLDKGLNKKIAYFKEQI